MDSQKINTSTFFNGMVTDIPIEMLQEGQYPHAVNATNNTEFGDMSKLTDEFANIKCCDFPYTYNGKVGLINERFLIFSTNNTDSEIGLFDEKNCTYTTIITDRGKKNKLGLKTTNPIKGVSKENIDCSESAYWNDGINPARTLNLSSIPFVKTYKPDPQGGCDIEVTTSEIDIEKLRLTPLLTIPEIAITKGDSGGSLPNGSYRIFFAYAEQLFRITDYLKVSDPIFLYSQTTPNGAIKVEITNVDSDFRNYELVLVSTINQQTTARLIGRYPIEQKTVYIDSISERDETIDLQSLANQSVYYEGGDAMFVARDYLIQTGPRTRPSFNYQPQANKIRAKWVAYAVPENYYRNSGTKIGYTKGELIQPFIRFVYNTGHRTASFPLVNREATNSEKQKVFNADSKAYSSEDVETWEIYDTSTITTIFPSSNQEEYPIAEGEFGYYESLETYPNNKEVWGSLACKPQRLFRFPENCVVQNFNPTTNKIQILGFKLENITYPLDNKGKPVEGIVGYEVLRADKEGNKTIVAKGLIFNTGEYDLQTSYNNKTKALYPNFPFNDLSPNIYLSKNEVKGGCEGKGYSPLSTFNSNIFTFHSPETSFSNPILPQYLKVEAEYQGKASGYFEECYKHPKHKLIRDFSLLLAGAIGIGEGLLAIKGKTTKTYKTPSAKNDGEVATGGVAAQAAGSPVANTYQKIYDTIRKNTKNIPVIGMLSDTILDVVEFAGTLVGATPGGIASSYEYSTTDTAYKNVPSYVKIGTNVVLFSYFFAQGTKTTLDVIKSLVPYRQHGYQCNMEGLYNAQVCVKKENIIRKIEDYSYLQPHYQDFQNYRINNLTRESSLVLKLNQGLINPSLVDNSRQTIGSLKNWENPTVGFNTNISAYYASIKRKDKNVYGQLDNIKIVPTSSEIFPINSSEKTETTTIFGGDTIIEEFTIKRKTPLFTQTQADGEIAPPNGYEFDYRKYKNIIHPRYWMDTSEYDLTQLFNISNIRLPNDSFYLDRNPNDCKRKVGFSVNNGYMYTSVNGVVRFYVESSYNLPFRQNNFEDIKEKHFDKRNSSNLSELFRNDILQFDNVYNIDRSLSPIKQLNITYSQMLSRDFTTKTNSCYTYEPWKLLYSLPNVESKKDNWRNFLTNNYWLFSGSDGKVISIRPFNRTGILYFFENAPLKIHSGIDELQTENGLKVIIGDGGLFARPPQTLTNTDFDYTECQSSEGIVSTPYGIFFISQRQGKIFKVTDAPQDISFPIKWHLSQHLPCKLQKYFPNFTLTDNTTIGVGCTTVYDNINELVYFSKIDYVPRKEYINDLTYYKDNIFLYRGRTKIFLQDPTYFESASWTLSYDPKANKGGGAYVSWHKWYPEASIQSKLHFCTIKDQSIWRHNVPNDSFCKYYGVQHEFSIDVPQSNIQNVTTLESIEWYLECYKRVNNDRFHLLLENFDRGIVYNTEQCSGLLKFNMRDSQKPQLILNYPQYNTNLVEVEVTKKEQKYRLNQFKDLTKNRGEFSSVQNPFFITLPNGFEQVLNPNAINYNKNQTQRKKFRHIKNVVRLIKNKPENQMVLTLVNTKQLNSLR